MHITSAGCLEPTRFVSTAAYKNVKREKKRANSTSIKT